MIHFTSGYALATSHPMEFPRMLWKTLGFSSFAASGSTPGHPPSNVASPDTSSWWGSSTGSTDRSLTLGFGAPKTVDAVGLAGHNLGGDELTLEGATDAGLTSWVSLFTGTPGDDSTLLVLFASQNIYGLRIKVAAGDVDKSTEISVVYVEQALVIPVPGYKSLGPLDLNVMTKTSNYRSETGQFAGRFTQFIGLKGTLILEHLPEAWVRSAFKPVLRSMRSLPFFIANRPSAYPDDCGFAWTVSDVVPERMGLKSFMRLAIEVNAHVPHSLL